MTLYYIKQDNTVWCCEEDSGPYYEEIEESFVDCKCLLESEMTADHLQGCAGGGIVLKWRKAKTLEIQAFESGKDEGFEDGFDKGIEYQKKKEESLESGYKKLAKDPEMFTRVEIQHHHGFDFYPDKQTAKCVCGVVVTNPYIIGGGTNE